MRLILDYIGWIACCIYCTVPLFWLVIHPFAQHWRRHGRGAYRILLPVWGVFIVGAAVVTWPWLHVRIYDSWWACIPGALLLALGLFIYRRAFSGFSRVQISGLPELEPARHAQALITTGIRARVRHPIYLGHLCESIAWAVATGSVALFMLVGFALFTGAWMLHVEDRELEQRFGEPYRQYRRSVPAILPRLL